MRVYNLIVISYNWHSGQSKKAIILVYNSELMILSNIWGLVLNNIWIDKILKTSTILL